MEKGPKFDFSKEEDQEKFDKLPEEKQEIIAEKQEEEGGAINNLVSSGVAGNFERADEILNEYKKSSDFSFEKLSKSLEKVKDFDNEIKNVSKDIGVYKEDIGKLELKESGAGLLIEIARQRQVGARAIRELNRIEKLKGNTKYLEYVVLELKKAIANDIVIAKIIGEKDYNKIKEEGKLLNLDKEYTSLYNELGDRGAGIWDSYWGVVGKHGDLESTVGEEKYNTFIEKNKQISQKANEISSKLAGLIKENIKKEDIKNIEDEHLRLLTAEISGFTNDYMQYLYESPSSIEEFKNETEEMGIDQFIGDGRYSDGDKYLGYREGVWKEAREHVINKYGDLQEKDTKTDDLREQKESLEKKLVTAEANKKNLEVKSNGYSKLIESSQPIDSIEKNMPWAIDFVGNEISSNIKDVKVDTQENTLVTLGEESHYYGSGGIERGVRAKIVRDNPSNIVDKYYKYRDPYNEAMDSKKYDFNELEILEIDEKNIKINFKNSIENFEQTEIIPIEKANKESIEKFLSQEEKELWNNNYEKLKEKLLDESYLNNAVMPEYINYRFYEGIVPSGASSNRLVPYERSRIVDEFIDDNNGIATIIIKSQMDHGHARGKQFQWKGFKIDKNGNSKLMWSDHAYEWDMRNGKRIEMKASDLLKLSEEKE